MNYAIQSPTGFACLVKPTRVARVVNIDDLFWQDYTALRFERTIHWFRSFECESVVLDSNGLILHKLGAWNDGNGLEASLDTATDDARHVQGEYAGMAIRVGAVIRETPFIAVPEFMSGQTHWSPEFRKTLYHRVPGDWAFDDERVERWRKACESARDDGGVARCREDNQLLYIDETKVNAVSWRSDWSDEENEEARAGLLAFAQDDSKKETVG